MRYLYLPILSLLLITSCKKEISTSAQKDTSKATAQKNDVWFRFHDEDKGLVGFKDAKGNIKIEPKFVPFTSVQKFEAIIGVIESTEDNYESYYLLKNGTKVGRDSLYMKDFIIDCESEGFIKFYIGKTQLTGMIDHNGKVVIPAEYCSLTSIQNGLSIGLKGAFQYNPEIVPHGHKHEECNHWRWKGGKSCLINTKNEVLIENFPENRKALDLFTMQLSEELTDDITRDSFMGVNGKYYSFVNNDRLFDQFINNLVNGQTKDELLSHCYPKIAYIKDREETIAPAEAYIHTNYNDFTKYFKLILYSRRISYKTEDASDFDLPDVIKTELEHQYDNCGNRNYTKHPIKKLNINDRVEKIYANMYFVKTEDGYKLIYITKG